MNFTTETMRTERKYEHGVCVCGAAVGIAAAIRFGFANTDIRSLRKILTERGVRMHNPVGADE